MSDLPILIAGGGIAGLASALALAARREPCVVLEREAVFSESGAGLQLGPNAVRALQAIGAWQAVSQVASRPPAIDLRDARSGHLIQQIDVGARFEKMFGAAYHVVLRADLHRALLSCVSASPVVKLVTDFEVKEVTYGHGTIAVASAAGRRFEGTHLIATDGVHSLIRHLVLGTPGPRTTREDHHRTLLTDFPAEGDWKNVTVWMGAGCHVVHYPVGAPAALNLVCVLPEGRKLGEATEKFAPHLQDLLKSAKSWSTWPSLYVDPLADWAQDRVLLLGDAAHATVPYMAQGAAMALEDAAALRVHGVNAYPVAARGQRTRKLHYASLRQGKMYHLPAGLSHLRDLALGQMSDRVFFQSLKWLYGTADEQ